MQRVAAGLPLGGGEQLGAGLVEPLLRGGELGLRREDHVGGARRELPARLGRSRLRHDGPATFYVWHDPQAGQLRCSTRSCGHDQLPFETAYRTTGDLQPIVVEFLEDRAPGAIAWGQMEPVPFPDGPVIEEDEIAVWVCDLSQPAPSPAQA